MAKILIAPMTAEEMVILYGFFFGLLFILCGLAAIVTHVFFPDEMAEKRRALRRTAREREKRRAARRRAIGR